MAQNKQTLSSANGLFRSVIENSINDIFLIEPDTLKFVYANKKFIQSLEYSQEDLLNSSFEDILTNEQRSFGSDMVNTILVKKRESISFQIDIQRDDCSYYTAKVNLKMLQHEGKSFILGISEDLGQQKRNNLLLEKEKQKTRELQLSNKYKSTFFANLSHEMRTTLNSTLLLSEILSENRPHNLDENQLTYIKTIYNSTTSLLTLLNEVLDLSKIESGKMSIRPEYLEIQEFCKELECLFQPVASEKGINFAFTNELVDEITFKTDKLRLEQVLKNLISNALKFTNEGSVKLRLYQPSCNKKDSCPHDNSTDMIAFQVIDTGKGIASNNLDLIFKEYEQAEAFDSQHTYSGTGLGLSISKEITELLGGKIEVESKLGKGSTFTVILPTDSSEAILKNARSGKIKLTTDPALGDRIKPIDNMASSSKINGTVLLIDDSETHNMALSEFLSFKIDNTFAVGTATDAFEILNKEIIDCIVLDMYLPDANGHEVLKKIKSNDKLRSIPVIIYSGKNITQHEENELETLADAIIQKNAMSYKVLLAKIIGVLQKVLQPMKKKEDDLP
ncbi:ATP-binding protein [Gracilimonas sp. Q87]|uniref:ATP-binding protein n=1 Tax=Gracilimonas sp. Q87 TaxID=3384766 RepID=UPI003983E625